MTQTILIIEDEERIVHWLQRYFERAGFATLAAYDGRTGLTLARKESPALIILDLMLPELDGMSVARILRQESDMPIIMLTARGAHQDRIAGLELGADDYVAKPFDPEEVVARAKAVLRRVRGEAQTILRAGAIELNQDSHQVRLNGRPIKLSHTQFALLAAMMRHANQVLSREQLLNLAFNNDFDGFDRTIDSHIRRLRRRIEPEPSQPQYIQTVYGMGYQFVIPEGDA